MCFTPFFPLSTTRHHVSYPIAVTDPDVFVDYTYRLEAIDREYTFPNLVCL